MYKAVSYKFSERELGSITRVQHAVPTLVCQGPSLLVKKQHNSINIA